MENGIIIKAVEKIVPLGKKQVKRSVRRFESIPEARMESLKEDVVQISKTITKTGKIFEIPRFHAERLFYSGMTRVQIGELLGISSATVGNIFRQYGLWDAKTINKAKKMADEGMSLPQIANELGVPMHAVRGVFEKNGINTRGQAVLRKADKEEVQELINSGYSANDIATYYGIDVLTADKLFKKLEIAPLDYIVNQAAVEYKNNPTQENKIKALNLADKYLIKLAKEESEKKEACSYEDYLQSLRLDFLEQLENFRKWGIQPTGILTSLKKHLPEDIDMVMGRGEHPVSIKDMDMFSSVDRSEQRLERKDIVEYLLNGDPVTGGYLDSKQREVLKLRFGLNGKEFKLDKIGEMFGLTRERIRQINEKAIRRVSAFAKERPYLENDIGDLI